MLTKNKAEHESLQNIMKELKTFDQPDEILRFYYISGVYNMAGSILIDPDHIHQHAYQYLLQKKVKPNLTAYDYFNEQGLFIGLK